MRATVGKYPLRRQFNIAIVVGIIQIAFLLATLILFAEFFQNIWIEANNTKLEPHHGASGPDYLNLGVTSAYHNYATRDNSYDFFYYVRIIAILKLTCLAAYAFILLLVLIVTILAIVNVIRLPKGHVLVPGEDPAKFNQF